MKKDKFTIRQRLDIAHWSIIAITMVATLVCCLGCMSITYAWNRRTQNLSVMNNEDVLQTCRELTERLTDTIVKIEKGSNVSAFAGLEKKLVDDNTYILIMKDGDIYYNFGEEEAVDGNLQNAVEEIGQDSYISSGNRQLYMRTVMVEDEEYEIYIFIYKVSHPYREVATWLGCILIGGVVVFVVAFFFINRFLLEFVFSKIRRPLDILEEGVKEIQQGNLKYRLVYEGEDEFSSICENFNLMAQHLQESTDKILHQEQNRKVLLASISHDLRTPLTSISAYAGGLLDGIATTKEAQERYLNQIKAKVTEMVRMVNRLFMFSKMDMDEYPTYPVLTQLDKEVSSFVNAIYQEYEENGLEIKIERAEECLVMIDTKQLHTILSNVIENSLRYKCEDVGHLFVSIYEEGEECILKLVDDGPGTSEEDIDKIFEVFYRSDPARKNTGAGSGLGLAIVANAVKRANGKVEAANVLPHGLEITIRLTKEGKAHEEDINH